MVNGAGLAMGTMDVDQATAAGFPRTSWTSVGAPRPSNVTAAFQIILSRPVSVKAVLVNIFGGIMKCDVIAKEGIEAAA